MVQSFFSPNKLNLKTVLALATHTIYVEYQVSAYKSVYMENRINRFLFSCKNNQKPCIGGDLQEFVEMHIMKKLCINLNIFAQKITVSFNCLFSMNFLRSFCTDKCLVKLCILYSKYSNKNDLIETFPLDNLAHISEYLYAVSCILTYKSSNSRQL